MSEQLMRLESAVAPVPGIPEPRDLADLWLTHALSCLLDGCAVPVAARRPLLELHTIAVEPYRPPRTGAGEAARDRADACRLAVLFGGLAVEARVDRLLRNADATDWPAIAHLTPPERFRIARRLLDGPEDPAHDDALYRVALDLFTLRDELVDAVGRPGAALTALASEFSPASTRAMVAAAATLCQFLADLAHEEDSRIAAIVRQAAETLAQRAAAISAAPSAPPLEWEWEAEFPPDLVGS